MSAVAALLAPRSVAVVGASAARPTAGTAVIANLRRLGFEGAIYPVNPKYDAIDGLRCYASLDEVPGHIDAVFIGVPAAGVAPLVEEAGRRGVPVAVVTASGFADAGPEGAALQAGLVETATAAGVAVCGPNNMGVVNWLDRAAIWSGTLTPPLRTGSIGMISQSGSVAMLAAADDRNLGYGIVVSSGNEAVLTSAEYLDALARDDRIRVILHFVETIKRPAAYAAAARQARELGKPIIVLKVGRTERGRAATVAHTGSLAGGDEEFDAYCRACGLVRVATLDEMLETAELFSRGGAPRRRGGVCLMAMSGGEVALLSDLATEAGLPLAGLAPATRQALAAAFPPYTTIANPLDAWGAGWNPETHRAVARALLHDPGVSVVACALDPDARNGRASTPVARELAQIHLDLAREAPDHAAATVIFNNTSAALSPVLRELLDGSGVAYLQGTEEALRAIGHWVRFHQAQRRPRPISGELIPSDAGAPRPPAALAAYLQNRESRVLDEHASLALLAAYGIPVAPSRLARTAAEAARHAKAIGFPVVLKAVSSRLPHKSDVGAVMLDIRSATAARAAFNTIVSRAREAAPTVTLDGVLVARMASPGLELMLGASLGPYGAVVLVGHGGVDVETHRDVAHALAPVDAEEAEAMLARLRMFPLFGAARGRPARDVAAVIEMIVRLSRLAVDCGPRLDAIDVNPVIVQAAGAGACAVDGLVVLRRSVDGTPATDGRLDTHNVI